MTLTPLALLGDDDTQLAIRSAILHANDAAPRSQQTDLGPSEIGDPCLRRLAYKVAGTAASNTGGDQWRATVGTATHAWLASALEAANEALGALGPRWIVEQRVTVADDLTGSCDAYDLFTRRVVDFKVVGKTSLDKARRHGPSEQYRTQVHLYGKGHTNAGHDVAHVAILYLPASGSLGDAVWWTEPYDQAVADAALARMATLRLAISLGTTPAMVPASPADERRCLYCPFYAYGSNDLDVSCPGVEAESTWLAAVAS